MISTPVLLLGLLGLLIWGGLWGWRNLTAPLPTPEPTPCVTRPTDKLVPSDLYVRVLNGGFTRGLAERVSSTLRELGFNVIGTGNTEEDITGTIIRARRESLPGMQLVGSALQGVEVDYDDRIDGTIDVLVGSEFGGFGEAPWPDKVVDSGLWCFPPQPVESGSGTPTASANSTAAQDEDEDASEPGGEQPGAEPTE